MGRSEIMAMKRLATADYADMRILHPRHPSNPRLNNSSNHRKDAMTKTESRFEISDFEIVSSFVLRTSNFAVLAAWRKDALQRDTKIVSQVGHQIVMRLIASSRRQ
jgi:hypothetical protein